MKTNKKVIFFFMLLSIFVSFSKVKAVSTTTNFYFDERLDYYYIRENSEQAYYGRAIIIKNRDGVLSYCLEPFKAINLEEQYSGISALDDRYKTKFNLEKLKRAELLAYYGYGYKNHLDKKWYTITQMMIWKTMEPENRFVWRNKDTNQPIDIFQEEMAELNNLVNNHLVVPNLIVQPNLVENFLTVVDENNVLDKYNVKRSNSKTMKRENKIYLTDDMNYYTLELERNDLNTNEVPMLFFSPNDQTVLTVGKPTLSSPKYEFNNPKGGLIIKKVDADNKEFINQGQGKLAGAVYGVFNLDKEKITEMEVDEEGIARFENLKLGTYLIKEIRPGEGYHLDEKEYEVTIEEFDLFKEMVLENKIIKGEVNLKKYLGDETKKIPEKNIAFEIYDNNNQIVKEVITNDLGVANFTLPYGHYLVKQKNTTEGYEMVEDFKLDILTSNTEDFILVDFKIPDAGINNQENYLLIIFLVLIGAIIVF